MARNDGTAAARLVAELRQDGLDAVADVIGWAVEATGGSATDLSALTKFADWCRQQQVTRDVETTLTLKQLAEIVGQSPQTIARAVRDGLLRTPGGPPDPGGHRLAVAVSCRSAYLAGSGRRSPV